MKTVVLSCKFLRTVLSLGLSLSAAVVLFPHQSQGQTTLFSETFNGYTNFPAQIPAGDPVNPGIPDISEGASEFWFAARFQTGDGTIDSDLAVQRWGDGQHGVNKTPTGRFADDAGIIFRIDTSGFTGVTLAFDWRTFQAESPDKVTVGYHPGDNLGFTTSGPNRFLDLQSGSGSWALGWTQLLAGGARNSFKHETYALPANAGPIYVAFWLNDGGGDYGKVDNICVTGTPILIPEPAVTGLVLLGLVTFIQRHRFRN